MTTTKNLLEGRTGPITQSIEAVKNLLAFVGRASDPLPSDVSLDNGRLVLVLSNKRDAYYCTTACACSCPANTWHPGQPCKHQRRYFAEQIAKPAAMEGAGSISPNMRGFRPVDTLPSEEKVSSSLSAIDCHDTTALDVAYHSIKADREMWPAEA